MAGTYQDQAYLASLNDFITLVKVALLKRAVELDDGSTKQTVGTLNLISSIMSDPDSYAKRMGWLIAATNATVGAAAPAVPSASDVQYCVNTLLPKLVR
jgi:hypothetical protein